MPTTLDWLRGLDDDRLVALLAARPDLAVPAPVDFDSLARRLNTGPSVWRALEQVDRFGIEVLTGLVVLHAETRAVSPDDVAALLGPAAPASRLAEALDGLRALGLVRGDTAMRIPHPVTEALGPHPAGLGAETGLSAERVAAELADVSERGRGILTTLAAGPPVGSATPGGPIGPVLDELVAADLLIRKEGSLVELPREVGLALRGASPLGELHPDPPRPRPRTTAGGTVDSTGAGQALQVHRELTRVIESLTAAPVAALKAGGIGVRETRRLTRELGFDEATLSLLLEILAAGNLISGGEIGGRPAAAWTATLAADTWLSLPEEDAWAFVAAQWLDLRRDPARVGQPDVNGKALALLSPELSWLRGPADRRWVLRALAELPAGAGLSGDDLRGVLAWRNPLHDADRRERVITGVLTQATVLGLVAFDALTTAGRAVLAGGDDVAAVLRRSLPEPVSQVLVQADLTVVAPGRLAPELAAELAVAAEIESAGSATVYRVTQQSVRRALDQGWTASDLHRLFRDHSATPVPQGLTYLIDDVARRHGVLRAGTASAYVRCEDPVIIDQAIAHARAAGIVLRRLAPTVAITSTEPDELLTELRKAGLLPVAEDESGAVVTLNPNARRGRPGLNLHQRWREPAAPSREQLAVLVERMRTAPEPVSQSPAEAIALLREASAARAVVWIEYVNAEGAVSRRLVEPLAMSGGALAAFDRLSSQVRSFVLHRITAVTPYRETQSPPGRS